MRGRVSRFVGSLVARAELGGGASLAITVDAATDAAGPAALVYVEHQGVANLVSRATSEQLATAALAFEIAGRELLATTRETTR